MEMLLPLVGFILIMVIGVVVLDKFVKKKKHNSTDDETAGEIFQTEQEEEDAFVGNNKTSGITKKRLLLNSKS